MLCCCGTHDSNARIHPYKLVNLIIRNGPDGHVLLAKTWFKLCSHYFVVFFANTPIKLCMRTKQPSPKVTFCRDASSTMSELSWGLCFIRNKNFSFKEKNRAMLRNQLAKVIACGRRFLKYLFIIYVKSVNRYSFADKPLLNTWSNAHASFRQNKLNVHGSKETQK